MSDVQGPAGAGADSTTAAPSAAGAVTPRGVFVVPLKLRSWTIGLLGAHIAMDAASILHSWAVLGLVGRVRAGEEVDQGAATIIDSVGGLVGLAGLGVYLATAVVFCCWFYRVNANARLLTDEKPPMGPGMAVGSFFIPIVCLFYPYRAAAFSWRVSARAAEGSDGGAPGTGLVGAWWGLWVAVSMIGQIVFRQTVRSMFGDEEPTLDQIAFQEYGSILLCAADVLTAVLCIGVVKRLTGMQARIAQAAAA